LGANHGTATTEAPKTANTVKAAKDLIIGLLTVGRKIPLLLGTASSTTVVSIGSGTTTYICVRLENAASATNVRSFT
jgi:hypothetical protein